MCSSIRATALEIPFQLIVLESSNPRRYDMAVKLADETGYPVTVVWRDVERLIDAKAMRQKEQRVALSSKYARRLAQTPDAPGVVAQDLMRELQSVDAGAAGYNPTLSRDHWKQVLVGMRNCHEVSSLVTGWPVFDDRFGGIPLRDAFISIPGKPNHSKSSFCSNLAWRLVEHNPDITVVYHSG